MEELILGLIGPEGLVKLLNMSRVNPAGSRREHSLG